jgi:hypothetical protein
VSTPAGLAEWQCTVPVTVSVHVYPGSGLAVTPFPGEDRAVVHVTGVNKAQLDLYARRADLARLAEAIAAALADLDGATVGESESAPAA